MSEKRSIVFEALEALGVPYEVWEHPAVYTIEEMDALHLPDPSVVVRTSSCGTPKGSSTFWWCCRRTSRPTCAPWGSTLG